MTYKYCNFPVVRKYSKNYYVAEWFSASTGKRIKAITYTNTEVLTFDRIVEAHRLYLRNKKLKELKR
jgi:hypothetical protein